MKSRNLILRMSLAVFIAGALAGLTALSAPAAVKPAAARANVDPEADVIMRRMGEYLAQAQFYSVSAEVWQDVNLSSGQRLQAGRTVEMQVRRPNRFHAEIHSTRRNRGLFYDGKTLSLFDRGKSFYGTIPAPATVDEAIDMASDRFGISIPMEDLVISDPYGSAISTVTSGMYVGPVTVLGVACEHLAFTQGEVDWQIWIEQGAVPVPKKIVITYKDEEGSPEYTAIFSNWDFQTKLPDFVFSFEPPAGASKISVAEIKKEEKPRGGGK